MHTTAPTPHNERQDQKFVVPNMLQETRCSAAGVTPVGFRSNDVTLKLSQIAAKKNVKGEAGAANSQIPMQDMPIISLDGTLTSDFKEHGSGFLKIAEVNTSSEYLNSVREHRNSMMADLEQNK